MSLELRNGIDFLLSTLRTYVQAMGGSLDLVVRFADRDPVVLSSLEDVTTAKRKPRPVKRAGKHLAAVR